MLLRWLFLFALLANAILFFWYSLQIPPEVRQQNTQANAGHELRLVSEIDPALLIRTDIQQEQWCQVFVGLANEVQGQAVVSLMLEQGFQAYVRQSERQVVESYTVDIELPVDLEKRLAVMDLIEKYERKLLNEDELGNHYKVNAFASASAAEDFAGLFKRLDVQVQIKAKQRTEKQYVVSVIETSDRKLSKEIKEVVQESYSLIKIEKKLCEGVAKP